MRIKIVNYLCLLEESSHVTHAQDTRSHTLRKEWLKVVHSLTYADELDGLATDTADTEGGTTAGVTIHLRENGTGNADILVKSKSNPDVC
jgi:hypothetical protein